MEQHEGNKAPGGSISLDSRFAGRVHGETGNGGPTTHNEVKNSRPRNEGHMMEDQCVILLEMIGRIHWRKIPKVLLTKRKEDI